MADMASIIAGIDGYRRYEQNRAIDLNNQAQNMKNQEAGQILDLKTQLAALQNNPYAKYNIWDPVGRRQQLLSDDDQLKIASKWASSIKNLAPEKREQGYRQFLRAMPSLGIDVSDMPQGYDEGYIDMVAGLGVDTQTRYQNEQQNSRLERQIEANREARQDEFDKRLAAFDYENNYKTKAEKDKQLQIDNMIDASSLSPDDKERAKLAYRNITLPNVKTPQERLMDVFTNPDSTDEQRETARQGLRRIAELQKEVKALEPVKPESLKDKASTMNYLSTAVKDGTIKPEQASAVYENLTGDRVDFVAPPKTYAAGNVGTMQYLIDQGMPLEQARQVVLNATPEEQLNFEQAKSNINAENQIKVNAAASQNRITENTISNAQQNDYKLQQMQFEDALKRDYETWQKTLPIDDIIKADQIAEKLNQQGFNVSANDILFNQYRKDVLDNMKQQAEIEKTNAETEKTRAETPYAGLPEAAKEYVFTQQNPEAANSSFFKDTDKKNTGETKLREEFNKLTKDYRTVGDSYSRILKVSDKPSAAGDLSLIFNYMKMLDPNSVVRESEFSNAENARAWFSETGAPTAIALAYEKARTGQRLLPEQRADFVNMAGNLMKAQQASFIASAKQFRRLAEERGYNPDNVVFDPYASLSKGNEKGNDNQANYNFTNTSDNDLLVLGE